MKNKLIVWEDDELQFIRDGERDVYTRFPYEAKQFDTKEAVDEFMGIYFPCCSYTILMTTT